MRQFVYFSQHAVTSGKALSHPERGLMGAGRMDIAIHTIISGLFLSHDFRKDTVIHLVFYGMPDPPKHIEIRVTPELEISKKDIATLLKKILYKYQEGKKTEVLPGCFIEKRSFLKVIEDLEEKGSNIFVLDKKGRDIRELKDDEIKDNPVFILGDHIGLPPKELKRLKKMAIPVSVGPKVYFASQVASIVNNELDRRGI